LSARRQGAILHSGAGNASVSGSPPGARRKFYVGGARR
jgi:hypothetical protein